MSLICLLRFHMMPTDRSVHSWLFNSEAGMDIQHQGTPPAAGHEAWVLRLSCCAQPAPHWGPSWRRESPNRGKSSCRDWGSTRGSTACKRAAPWTSAPRSHSATKTHGLKDLFMIPWMGKDRRERGSSFKVKNLFTELKFKVELETRFQILYLLFNFKSPSALTT